MSVALKMISLMYCTRFQCIAVHATKAGEKTKMQSRATMCPREAQGLPASQLLLHGARTTLLGLPLRGFAGVLQVPQEQPSRLEQPSVSYFHPPLRCSRYLWHDSESNCVSQPSLEHMQISFRPLQKRCIIPLALV